MWLYALFAIAAGGALVVSGAPSWAALASGLVIALASGRTAPPIVKRLTTYALQLGVIALGAGMDLDVVAHAGLTGALITATSLAIAIVLGLALGKWLHVPGKTPLLVSVGTAICGGSAIAAVVPAIRAKDHEASIALATVFLLNAVGLVLFPIIGHALGLDETRFGLWAALSIHDTSSVVGAASAYGKTALKVATTVKLARALWIAPVALIIGALRARRGGPDAGAAKLKVPWFIFGFIGAAALVTLVPALAAAGLSIFRVAKQLLVLTLFLIGLGLDARTMREVGVRPLVHGVVLWLLVGSATLAAILAGLIH